MRPGGTDTVLLLRALELSAHKHRFQKRKDRESSPYINHPIEVASLLANVGGVTDVTTLAAAILHDTIEDTQTTPAELEESFGAEVCQLVQEMTDDKGLPKDVRKRLQVEQASNLSTRAKLIKLADKICNVRDVTNTPPVDWSMERRRRYLDWAEQVVVGCRGCNRVLEQQFEETLREGRLALGAET